MHVDKVYRIYTWQLYKTYDYLDNKAIKTEKSYTEKLPTLPWNSLACGHFIKEKNLTKLQSLASFPWLLKKILLCLCMRKIAHHEFCVERNIIFEKSCLN